MEDTNTKYYVRKDNEWHGLRFINVDANKYKFPGAIYDSTGKIVYLKEVIYNAPATIAFWSDGTKTVCKVTDGDVYSAEGGLALCILKKSLGNSKVRSIIEAWHCDEYLESPVRIDLSHVIKNTKK